MSMGLALMRTSTQGGLDLSAVISHVARGDGGEFAALDLASLDADEFGGLLLSLSFVPDGPVWPSDVWCDLDVLPDAPAEYSFVPGSAFRGSLPGFVLLLFVPALVVLENVGGDDLGVVGEHADSEGDTGGEGPADLGFLAGSLFALGCHLEQELLLSGGRG